MVYAQAVDFTPVMFWTIDGEVITPTNAPPVDGDGQHNYSPSSYTYTLQKKSNVQMQCHTTFEVQNSDKDDYVAINNPTYEDIHIVYNDVKGEYKIYINIMQFFSEIVFSRMLNCICSAFV